MSWIDFPLLIKYIYVRILNKDKNFVPSNKDGLEEKGIILPVNCFYPTSEEYVNNQNILNNNK